MVVTSERGETAGQRANRRVGGRWLWLVVIAAVGTLWVVPLIERPLNVQIRWMDGLSETQRDEAAARLGIRRLNVRGDGIWIVDASSATPEQVRALVEDRRVADTHDVDRRAFRLVGGSALTLPQWAVGWLPPCPQLDAAARAAKAPMVVLLLLLAVMFGRVVRRGEAPRLLRGVPDLSPHALAVFRMTLAVAFVAAVVSDIPPAVAHDLQRQVDWIARTEAIRDLAASTRGVVLLHAALVVALSSFAIGFLPRTSLAIGAVLLTLVSAVRATHTSIHDWGLPTMTLWVLVIAPWQEGFGVSASLRRLRGLPVLASTLPRGLAVWLPGLTVGVAFLAAAYAKLDTSGAAWVLDGAVRYHLIEDAAAAPLGWGLSLVRSDAAAVALSLGAVLIEATFWLVIWFRRPTVRALFGAAGAALLAGFYLFQGVYWPAWWALMLAFVPWSPVVDRFVAWLPQFVVLADGECPLCRRSARLLHALDWFDRLTFADASNDSERRRLAPSLDQDAALQEMYVLGPLPGPQSRARPTYQRLTAGYDGYLQLSRGVPLLWIPAAIGMFPPVASVGRAVYRRVASSRRRVGRCTDEVCAPGEPPLPAAMREDGSRRFSHLATIVVAIVTMQQVVASIARLESEPFVSDFGMYAYTWPSREAFDEFLKKKTRWHSYATDTLSPDQLDARLRGVPKAIDTLDGAVDRGVAGEEWPEQLRAAIAAVAREYRSRYGEPAGRVEVRRSERVFDWALGTFEPGGGMRKVGTIDLDEGTFMPADAP